jgi:hypothetical protein
MESKDNELINPLFSENCKLREEMRILEERVKELEERLKKYTNSPAHKSYYEAHKEEVKAKGKVYLQKLKEENPEKLKEYRRKTYLNKKKKEEEGCEE